MRLQSSSASILTAIRIIENFPNLQPSTGDRPREDNLTKMEISGRQIVAVVVVIIVAPTEGFDYCLPHAERLPVMTMIIGISLAFLTVSRKLFDRMRERGESEHNERSI